MILFLGCSFKIQVKIKGKRSGRYNTSNRKQYHTQPSITFREDKYTFLIKDDNFMFDISCYG